MTSARPQPSDTASETPGAGGPFAAPSPAFLQAPLFDQIESADFRPALEEAMRLHAAEVRAIADQAAAPTFENTLEALEASGRMLDRVRRVFFALAHANTDEVLQAIQAEMAPKLSAHEDAITLNPALYARIETIFAARESLGLDPEALQLTRLTHERFVRAGARLCEADKRALKQLNERLSVLSTTFQRRSLAAVRNGALATDDAASLEGLSADALAAAVRTAASRGRDGEWLIPLESPTQQSDLGALSKPSTRAALFERSWMRAERGDEADTRGTLLEIARLRAEKAALLGFANYAAYALQDQMLRTPGDVGAFLGQLVGPARASAAREAADIQALIAAEGANEALAPADWRFHAERVRKARFDVDEQEIAPYLELNAVMERGVFFAAQQLYGVTFKPRRDLPVYHPDVKTFEVIDHDGSTLGLMYFDMFKRDNKQGGAWMGNFVGQSKLLGTRPVIYNVTNLTKPADGAPALVSFEEVRVIFHEFGHALHGLFAEQTYPSLSGTNVARDFVELPSQINEYWAMDRQVLANYAVHHQTGEPMPKDLIARIERAGTFNQGYAMAELIAAAALDQQWHNLGPGETVEDVGGFETEALAKTATDFSDVPPRYRSSYFQHIWSGGYAAGYYSYLWSQVLADDGHAWFEAHGGMTRDNGQRFRDLILSRGRSLDYAPMFRAFYGADPDIAPMLERRGLTVQ